MDYVQALSLCNNRDMEMQEACTPCKVPGLVEVLKLTLFYYVYCEIF